MSSSTCNERIKFSEFNDALQDDYENVFLAGYTTKGETKSSKFENVKISLKTLKEWVNSGRFKETTIDPLANPTEFCELDPNFIYLYKRNTDPSGNITYPDESEFEEWVIVEVDDNNVAGGFEKIKKPERLGGVSVSLEDYIKKGVVKIENLTDSDDDQRRVMEIYLDCPADCQIISVDSVLVVKNLTYSNRIHCYYEKLNDFSWEYAGLEHEYAYLYIYGELDFDEVKRLNTFYREGGRNPVYDYVEEVIVTYSYIQKDQLTKLANKNY